MIFDNWYDVNQIVFKSIIVYVCIIIGVRAFGKRTTSKMNNFDWVVTVALGSMVSSAILSETIALIEGLVGIAMLIVLQFVVTALSVRFPTIRRQIRSTPTMLYYRGEFLDDVMRKERVSKPEILSVARENGYTSLENVYAIILEPNAKLSFVQYGDTIPPVILAEDDIKEMRTE